MRHKQGKEQAAAPIKIELKGRPMTLEELKAYYNSPEFKEWLDLARKEYHTKLD
jgi:hypothetical protein